jgi:predicted transcriptional regulator of viral defense system
MNAAEALGELRLLGQPVIETREASARLGISSERTTQLLRSLQDAGLAERLRRGIWLLDPQADSFVLPPYLTAPYPSYVSLYSALSHHGMIEQIPRQISVVSVDRPQTITTPKGTYSIHHVAPEVFGGFSGTPETGYLATPEKALFDAVYIRAARRQRVYLPEIELADSFDPSELAEWTNRITPGWLRTIVRRELERVVGAARKRRG